PSAKRTCSSEHVWGGAETSWVAGQAGLVDVVAEVAQDSFGGHPERGGDELGVHGVDEVGQARAAHGSWWHPGGVKKVTEVGGGGRLDAGLGALGDDEVWVLGVLALPVLQASLEHGPAGRVQRYRQGPTAESDGAVQCVDVVAAE